MGFGISFAPLVPAYVLWAAVALAVVLAMLLAFVRSRGWAVRALALAVSLDKSKRASRPAASSC